MPTITLTPLRADGVSVTYGDRRVLSDVSLTVAPGSRLGLIGEAWAATPEKGERLLDAISRDVADALANPVLWDAPI